MEFSKRYEFHSHTLLSDGELLVSEHVRRAEKLGYEMIAITDHADATNIDYIMENLNKFLLKEAKYYNIKVIPGVELTHVPPEMIDELALYAKEKGAKLVIVHGETIVEPVMQKTNFYSVSSKNVDILAHPGFITLEEAKLAKSNNVFLELTSRKGHSLTNGHVAKVGIAAGAKLILNTDTHSPSDFITQSFAYQVAMAAGLTPEQAFEIIESNPKDLIKRFL